MKILLVSPFLPHEGVLHAGGKLVHFLHLQLAARHDVTLVTRCFPEEVRALEGLRENGFRVHAAPAVGPWFTGGSRTLVKTIVSYRSLVRLAERVVADEWPDVCQVEFTETAYFWRPRRMPPSVITCHDLVAKRAFRSASRGQGIGAVRHRLLAKAQTIIEARALRRFREVILLSDIEEAWLNRLYPDLHTRVLRYPGGIGFTGLPRREIADRVLFVGALGRPQNVEGLRFLLQSVWPTVKREHPAAVLSIVGAGAPPELIAEMSSVEGVQATGEVDSVESAYREAAVFVAPILVGGGIIVKILDALAAGVPVVTTPYGNEGIDAAPGREILVAESSEAFAADVVRLLSDAGERQAIGAAGQRFAETRFPPAGVLETLEAAYSSALQTSGANR